MLNPERLYSDTQEEGKLAHETALLALLGEEGGPSVQLAAQVETLVALLLGLGRGARGLMLCIEVTRAPSTQCSPGSQRSGAPPPHG